MTYPICKGKLLDGRSDGGSLGAGRRQEIDPYLPLLNLGLVDRLPL
jgi:hypothetical protein